MTGAGGSFPEVGAEEIGWITREDMIEIDRVMIEDLHIELLQMMENAGRNLARLVLSRFRPREVVVLAGPGGNGGGGLVAARHLHNIGVDVRIIAIRQSEDMSPAASHQLDITDRMGIDITREAEAPLGGGVVLIDALIGYSLSGAPRGIARDLIGVLNTSECDVVALDVPSGLDVNSGTAPGDVVSASATMTLAQPKVGLRTAPQVGELYVADISVPPTLLAEGVADFAGGSVIRIRR